MLGQGRLQVTDLVPPRWDAKGGGSAELGNRAAGFEATTN